MGKWTSYLKKQGTPPVWAARYEAIIQLNLGSANLQLNTAAAPGDLQTALRTQPEWSSDPWESNPGQTIQDLEMLALQKLKALFDFDARLPNGSSDAVRAALQARFPSIPNLTERGYGGADSGTYKKFAVQALVLLDDGQAQWTASVPETGALPPGIGSADLDSGSELKTFLQNVVRADIISRMGR